MIIKNIFILSLILVSNLFAYPMDATKETGINRLEGYLYAIATRSGKEYTPWGARLNSNQVKLNLINYNRPIPPSDARFSQALKTFLGSNVNSYGVALLDLSNLNNPVLATHNAEQMFAPGSVSKVLVALAVFQALADIYPNDIEARKKVLKDSVITADRFIESDTHEVPFWDLKQLKIYSRPIQIGDTANLYTYLDWMMSASSNAAASMVIKHLVMLKLFKTAYLDISKTNPNALAKYGKAELQKVLVDALVSPLARNGINPNKFRQGSFFTKFARASIPGSHSAGNLMEMLRFLYLMEQGQLIDEFSSLELKKLMYLTQVRFRYSNAKILDPAAIYYKSGSLYKCRGEAGYSCRKYYGNVQNLMNSIAVVEYPAKYTDYYYLVAVVSNVLRRDSAKEHELLAHKIQAFIEAYHR